MTTTLPGRSSSSGATTTWNRVFLPDIRMAAPGEFVPDASNDRANAGSYLESIFRPGSVAGS
jgi:hypothetical protein